MAKFKRVVTEDHHYNGKAYKKPRSMKPKNMSREAVVTFLGNKKKKPGKK